MTQHICSYKIEIRTNVRIGGNYMKRYIIKSKVRFLFSVCLIMLFTVSSLFTLVANAKENNEVVLIPEYVKEGDTLWSLSLSYSGEMDIRNYISNVMEINDLHNANIKPGKIIYFPTKAPFQD